MKLFVVLCVFTAVFCVRESDGFKILKKLKDLLHPTESSVSTTTVLPTIPAYENRPGNRDSDETSDSDESTDSTDSKHSYNSIKDKPLNKHPEGSYQTDSHTTETSNFNSGYGSNIGSTGNTGSSSYDNFNNNDITSTTTDAYGQVDREENHPIASSSDSYANLDVRSTTPASYGFGSQDQPDREGVNNQKTQTTTEYNIYNVSYNSNTSENPSSFGGVSIDDILSGIKKDEDSWNNFGTSQSTTTENSNGPVGGTGDDQTSVFSNTNENNSQSTTSRSYYSSNDKHDTPEQPPSYSNYNGKVSSTTPTYANTNLNEIQPRPYPGSSYSSDTVATTPKTPTAVNSSHGSSVQDGNQQNYASGVQPSYSTGKLNQTKNQDPGGEIIFPDHPSLNPTQETERVFSENDPAYKQLKGYHNQTPAPVPVDGDRRILDTPTIKCGPGQALDPKKNVCRALARK